jgi:hypothetical protein
MLRHLPDLFEIDVELRFGQSMVGDRIALRQSQGIESVSGAVRLRNWAVCEGEGRVTQVIRSLEVGVGVD